MAALVKGDPALIKDSALAHVSDANKGSSMVLRPEWQCSGPACERLELWIAWGNCRLINSLR